MTRRNLKPYFILIVLTVTGINGGFLGFVFAEVPVVPDSEIVEPSSSLKTATVSSTPTMVSPSTSTIEPSVETVPPTPPENFETTQIMPNIETISPSVEMTNPESNTLQGVSSDPDNDQFSSMPFSPPTDTLLGVISNPQVYLFGLSFFSNPESETLAGIISFPDFVEFISLPKPDRFVAGTLIELDRTALLLYYVQFTSAWLIPVIVSAIGIGIVIARKFQFR